MNLYGATALIEGKPVASFLIARDPDEAASKAMKRLKNGTLTHIVFFCEARLGTLKRNGLLEVCPKVDQVLFCCETLLEMIGCKRR